MMFSLKDPVELQGFQARSYLVAARRISKWAILFHLEKLKSMKWKWIRILLVATFCYFRFSYLLKWQDALSNSQVNASVCWIDNKTAFIRGKLWWPTASEIVGCYYKQVFLHWTFSTLLRAMECWFGPNTCAPARNQGPVPCGGFERKIWNTAWPEASADHPPRPDHHALRTTQCAW